MPSATPTLYIVAGPNGSGKSTLTRSRRFGGVELIDPDAIARRISLVNPEEAVRTARREAVRTRRAAVADGRTVLVETTLAGKTMLLVMDQAHSSGYKIELHYVCVSTVAQALDRIANRVALGGQGVPEEDVRRRFDRSLANLPTAIALSDETWIYDNASPDDPYREVAILTQGSRWIAGDPPAWLDPAALSWRSVR